ncbi:MAG TPA: YciI family protein [Rhodocyclaceae bacterium]|nr:YciI family protein [Rhodocyclaceae bacterium]
MYVIFFKFAANRAQASQWMAEHGRWIQEGIDSGVFLMAGSLDNAQGGAILAASVDRDSLMARVQRDPFVAHGVVSAELHGIAPSRIAPGLEELLSRTPASSAVT